MSHYVKRCSCGNVIEQCRCASKNKDVVTVTQGCQECKTKMKPEAKDIAGGFPEGFGGLGV